MAAIILVSGGIDSTVLLAHALSLGRRCTALTFDYGQRHRAELDAAKEIARFYNVPHRMIRIDPLSFDQSALVSQTPMAKGRSLAQIVGLQVPSTYVPARNTLFLAYAMAQAEIFHASEIYLGANASDVAYPDCSPAYLACFNQLLQVGTRQARLGEAPQLRTPLIECDKAGVIRMGQQLKVPFHLTLSCYDPLPKRVHCGGCDACVLRQAGFESAQIHDPTQYAALAER